MNEEDHRKREEGLQAHLALGVLEEHIEQAGEARLLEAMADHTSGQLTPEKAYAHLVALLEMQRTLNGLRARVATGVQATHRIQAGLEKERTAAEREKLVPIQGRNRFTRSKVPSRPRPPAA